MSCVNTSELGPIGFLMDQRLGLVGVSVPTCAHWSWHALAITRPALTCVESLSLFHASRLYLCSRRCRLACRFRSSPRQHRRSRDEWRRTPWRLVLSERTASCVWRILFNSSNNALGSNFMNRKEWHLCVVYHRYLCWPEGECGCKVLHYSTVPSVNYPAHAAREC